jgi:hypothetical protein
MGVTTYVWRMVHPSILAAAQFLSWMDIVRKRYNFRFRSKADHAGLATVRQPTSLARILHLLLKLSL